MGSFSPTMDHLLALLQLSTAPEPMLDAPTAPGCRKPSLSPTLSPKPSSDSDVSWFPSARAPRQERRGLRVRFDSTCKRCDSPHQHANSVKDQRSSRNEEIGRNTARIDKLIETAKLQAQRAKRDTNMLSQSVSAASVRGCAQAIKLRT